MKANSRLSLSKALIGAALALGVSPAFAQAGEGGEGPAGGPPRDWEIGFQQPATPVMHDLEWFHNDILLPLTIVISVFVLFLLLYVMVRYNSRTNPVPSKNTHNTMIEVVWTLLPVVILVLIAVPSFKLLFKETRIPDPDLTIKATGHAWNWEYDYPDQGDINFTAVMIQEADLKPGEPRLLTASYKVVVPVNKNIHVLVTGADVIHSWAVPAFGVKIDGIPGRMNETWFRAEQEGVFYGQCSELCGKDHAFMPIEVHVVSDELFAKWADAAKKDVDAAAKLLAEAEESSSHKIAAAEGVQASPAQAQ
jgi:cytochrome c oxidase subunit 2